MNTDRSVKTAIVTGGGSGIGRAISLRLAGNGIVVMVLDIDLTAAQDTVSAITENGGSADAFAVDVSNPDQIDKAIAEIGNRGRIDILINNAGILLDKSFLKMSMDDFRLVIDVHLIGSANCTKAVWEIMREQAYGRIVMTSSSTGLYGNFGQTNYGAAKMAMVGMMNTLHLEGAKYNIHVNCLAPTAGTAMTDGLLPDAVFKLLSPESVSPGVVFLASEGAPSRKVLCAGGGSFAVYKGFETEGVNLAPDNVTAEGVAEAWEAINNEDGMRDLQGGFEQTGKFATQGAKALGIDLA